MDDSSPDPPDLNATPHQDPGGKAGQSLSDQAKGKFTAFAAVFEVAMQLDEDGDGVKATKLGEAIGADPPSI